MSGPKVTVDEITMEDGASFTINIPATPGLGEMSVHVWMHGPEAGPEDLGELSFCVNEGPAGAVYLRREEGYAQWHKESEKRAEEDARINLDQMDFSVEEQKALGRMLKRVRFDERGEVYEFSTPEVAEAYMEKVRRLCGPAFAGLAWKGEEIKSDTFNPHDPYVPSDWLSTEERLDRLTEALVIVGEDLFFLGRLAPNYSDQNNEILGRLVQAIDKLAGKS